MTPVKHIVILLFFAFSVGCGTANPDSSLEGAWRVVDIKWIYPDTTYHIEQPQPGFLHFTASRYSFIWTPTKKARKPFEILANPTPEEMQAGFRSLVLNAGTYTKNDERINILAEVAKVPGFEGGTQVFTYDLSNDTLHFDMIEETYPDGTKPSWSGKMRTAFVLERIE